MAKSSLIDEVEFSAMARRCKRIGAILGGALLALAVGSVAAQELKIGYVNSERILRDSAPARAASQKLEQEFGKRDRELQEAGAKFKTAVERFEKDAPVLSETDRARRQREVAEMERELQRRQRELREDLNQRQREEIQALQDRAQRVVRQIAEQEKYDLIVQDAVFFGPRVDITERVLKALNGGGATK
jgi:outer membrane protein